MPIKGTTTKSKYNVKDLRAGFGSDIKGTKNVKDLAVASAYEREFEKKQEYLDSTIEDREANTDFVDETVDLDNVTVDDSAFYDENGNDTSLTTNKASEGGFMETKKTRWLRGMTANFDFSVHGTRFSGKRGHRIEGATIQVTPGLAIDLSPLTLMADPVSEGIYISEDNKAKPLIAYYNKETGVISQIDAKLSVGRDLSAISQDSIFLRSDDPVQLPLDNEGKYKLKASEGFFINNDTLYFNGGIISKENSGTNEGEPEGVEMNAGEVEIHDATVNLDGVPWDEKLGVAKQKKAQKKKKELSNAETALGIESISDSDTNSEAATDLEISLDEDEINEAFDESERPEVFKELTTEILTKKKQGLTSSGRTQLHIPFDRYRHYYVKYNNHQVDAYLDMHADKADNRISDEGLYFSYEDPWHLGMFYYIMGVFDTIFGGNEAIKFDKAFAKKDSSTEAKEEYENILEEFKGKNYAAVQHLHGDARIAYTMRWIKSLLSGDFKNLQPTQEEKTNMGIMGPMYIKDVNELTDIRFALEIIPPLLSAYLRFLPDFNVTIDWDVALKPSPDMPSLTAIRAEAMSAANRQIVAIDGKRKPTDGSLFALAQSVMQSIMDAIEIQGYGKIALLADASAKIVAGLFGNLGLVTADANLFAELSIHGNGDNDEALMAEFAQNFKLSEYKGDGRFDGGRMGDTALRFSGGVDIDGTVGTKGALVSPVFNNATKLLWKKDFASWDIASLSFAKTINRGSNKNLLGEKDAESLFSASVFSNEIINKSPKNYGFKFNYGSSDVTNVLKEGNNRVLEDKQLIRRANELLKANPEDLDIKELEKLLGELETSAAEQGLLMERTVFVHSKTAQDEDYNETIKDNKEDLAKAESNLSWLNEKIKSGKDITNKDIAKQGIDVKALEDFRSYIARQEAIEELATPEALIAYEKQKMLDDTEKARYNINLINAFDELSNKPGLPDDEGAIELEDLSDNKDKEKAEPLGEVEKIVADNKRRELIKNYLKNAKGGKDILSRLTDYADPQSLINYEIKAMSEETKKINKRITMMNEKLESLGVDANQGNLEFVKYYRDELDGKTFFEQNFTEFMTIDNLIDFEKDVLLDADGTKARDLYKFKQEMDKKKSGAENGILSEQDLKELRGFLYHILSIEDVASSITMTATPEELLEFEEGRVKEMMSKELMTKNTIEPTPEEKKKGKKKKIETIEYSTLDNREKYELLVKKLHSHYSFESQQRANKKLRDKGGISKVAGLGGTLVSGGAYVYDAYKHAREWFKETALKAIYRENIPVEEILRFEERMVQQSKDEMSDDLLTHRRRVKLLRGYVQTLRKFSIEEAKDAYENKIRERYFDGTIDIVSNDIDSTEEEVSTSLQDNTDMLEAVSKREYELSDSALLTMVEKLEEQFKRNFCGPFVERIEALKKMIADNMPQEYIYEKYMDMSGSLVSAGGHAFAQDKLKKLNDKKDSDPKKYGNLIDTLSADELYNLAKNKLRESSMQSFMVRFRKSTTNAVKQKVGPAVTSMLGMDEALSSDDMLHLKNGGLYERIEQLEALKDKLDKDDEFKFMTAEQKNAYIVKFYHASLKGGGMLSDALLELDLSDEKAEDGKAGEKAKDDKTKERNDKLKTSLQRITPLMLINYEMKRIQDATDRRQRRIDLLKSKKPGDDLSDYRQLAISDGKGLVGSINQLHAAIRDNYKTGADKYLDAYDVLDKDKIIDFEKKREKKAATKRNERVDEIDKTLKESGATNKDVLNNYKKMSNGAKGFIKEKSKEIDLLAEKKALKMTKSDLLSKFLNAKIAVGKDYLEKSSKPTDSLSRQEKIFKNMTIVTNDRKERIKKLIEKLKKDKEAKEKSKQPVEQQA